MANDDRRRTPRRPVVLAAGQGRRYDMGPVQAIFKCDGAETAGAYSISEWRLAPHTTGPGAHHHPEDDVFYVTAGTVSVLVGDQWFDAAAGSFVLVPGGVRHDFQNRGEEPAAMFTISAPGNFEQRMPGITAWFRDHPPGRAG